MIHCSSELASLHDRDMADPVPTIADQPVLLTEGLVDSLRIAVGCKCVLFVDTTALTDVCYDQEPPPSVVVVMFLVNEPAVTADDQVTRATPSDHATAKKLATVALRSAVFASTGVCVCVCMRGSHNIPPPNPL